MIYGYEPISPERMVEFIKRKKEEGMRKFGYKMDDEIPSFILNAVKKAASYNDFYKALIMNAILRVCAEGSSPTLDKMRETAERAENRITDKEKTEIYQLLSRTI